eukprot:3480571-Amphidinium_carterae.5
MSEVNPSIVDLEQPATKRPCHGQQPEPTLMDVMNQVSHVLTEVTSMRSTIAGIPAINKTLRLDKQDCRLDKMESRLLSLEGGSVCPSTVAFSSPPGLEGNEGIEPVLWLCGGMPGKTEGDALKANILLQCPFVLDVWVTSRVTEQATRTIVFVKCHAHHDRARLHAAVAGEIRSQYGGVWFKNGRSQQQEKDLAKANFFKNLIQETLAKSNRALSSSDMNIQVRARDAAVIVNSSKVARYEGGKERVDYSALTRLTGLSKEALLERLIQLDEQP